MLTKAEAALVAKLLGDLSDRYSSDGCNDFEVEDTPENREIVALAEGFDVVSEDDFDIEDGMISTDNTAILDHLLARLKAEYGIA